MWGRTLKDVFQRYKAMRGFHQRYQNGFDCQGLWVEVGVERELGLNSKQEIEEYGLAEFARRCREKVAWSAQAITEQSTRLGMWMDWGNDYYTFSDTNIEYIWRFLKVVHESGWLFRGHRSTEWCPRCGTSISQHELAGYYFEKTDPSLFVRFPLKDRRRRVTRRVDDHALDAARERRGCRAARRRVRAALERRLGRRRAVSGRSAGAHRAGYRARRARIRGAVRRSARCGCGHASRDPLGRGIAFGGKRDRAHRSGVRRRRTSSSPRRTISRFWRRSTRPGASTTATAGSTGSRRPRRRIRSSVSCTSAGSWSRPAEIHHRYPFCWRCETPLIFRLTDDWFIAADPLRQRLLDANATVDWVPDYFGKRMDDWLRNMGDWNISRKRYFGLPLPFYPCGCGQLTVIGSLAELRERATCGLEQLEELHRPWIDEVAIRCEGCGGDVRRDRGGRGRLARRRHRSVLDPRLAEPRVRRGRQCDRRGTWADPGGPPRPRLLGAMVPRRLGLGDARADPPLVLRAALHVGRAGRSRSVPSGALVREAARRDRTRDAREPRERDRRRRGLRAHGGRRDALDVLRAAAQSEHPLRLRAGRGGQAKAPHGLELRLVPRHLRRDRELQAPLRGSRPGSRGNRAATARPVAPRSGAELPRGGRGCLRGLPDRRRRPGVRVVRRRSLQLVHPPLATTVLGRRGRGRVPHALVRDRPGSARHRPDHAVPGRGSLEEPRRRDVRGRARERVPRRLAHPDRLALERHPPRGALGCAPGDRARPSSPPERRVEAPPASAPRGRLHSRPRDPRGRRASGRGGRGGAEREGGRVRRGSRRVREAASFGQARPGRPAPRL